MIWIEQPEKYAGSVEDSLQCSFCDLRFFDGSSIIRRRLAYLGLGPEPYQLVYDELMMPTP